jgi:hypothetical protein
MTHKAVLLVLVAVGFAGACAETRRTIGEDCLKSQDCLSGVCSQLVCVAAAPTTNQTPTGDGGAPAEAGETDASDGGTGAEAQAEAGADAGTDAPADATGQ